MTSLALEATCLVQALIRTSLVGGVVIAIAWAAVRALRGRWPWVRVWVWRLVYAKLTVLTLWNFPVDAGLFTPAGAVPASGYHISSTMNLLAPCLAGIWLLGVLAGCWTLWTEHQRARRIVASSKLVTDPSILRVYESTARKMGFRSGAIPPLAVAPEVSCPMVVGAIRPIVIVPEPETPDVLWAHELAHVLRRDLLWSWVVVAMNMVLFFHPLLWFASNQLRRARESAADAFAIRVTGTPPQRLAELLIQVSSKKPAPLLTPVATSGSMFGELRDRIEALGQYRVDGRRTRVALLAALGTITAVVLPPWRHITVVALNEFGSATEPTTTALTKPDQCFLVDTMRDENKSNTKR